MWYTSRKVDFLKAKKNPHFACTLLSLLTLLTLLAQWQMSLHILLNGESASKMLLIMGFGSNISGWDEMAMGSYA